MYLNYNLIFWVQAHTEAHQEEAQNKAQPVNFIQGSYSVTSR